MTETAAIADVVVPASSHFEKSGTFTNGERRIQRVNRVVDPLSGALPDGQIVVEVMRRLGYRQPDHTRTATISTPFLQYDGVRSARRRRPPLRTA